MPLKAKIILFALSLTLFLFVLDLIIKRRLKIEHSLLWLAVSVTILVMTAWQDSVDRIAFFLGIDYPPTLFLSIATFFALLMLFHYSVEISKLKEQNKTLNQEISLLSSLVDRQLGGEGRRPSAAGDAARGASAMAGQAAEAAMAGQRIVDKEQD